MDQLLSPNFYLSEFTVSRTATVHGISNTPSSVILVNLKLLAQRLEQVRSLLGDVPIHVTSAYRSPELNKMVKGVPDSAHVRGLAVDFVAPKFGSPLEICRKIQHSSLVFDQLIYENRDWVHLGLVAPGGKSRMELLSKFPNTGYFKGIIDIPY